jgi:hypothetical protein
MLKHGDSMLNAEHWMQYSETIAVFIQKHISTYTQRATILGTHYTF